MRIYNNRDSFYQWDTNQKVVHSFKPGDEVHFFNRKLFNALTVKAYILDGDVVANVPNILLQSSYPLYVYWMHLGQDGQYTKEEFMFKVKQRPKPADYVYTETELQSYKNLEGRIVNLEENGVSEEQIATAVEKYLEENPVDGVNFITDKTLKLENGVLSVNTVDQMEQDNTLPITSAGVFATVGNIEALLKTI